jgi:hypothetical protein
MLGCHDFCGHYEWTFHYVRRRFGQEAVRRLWDDAIGGESQNHYTQAALKEGLTGLYNCWVKTGEDEQCDWTWTVDERKNVLRWDMRKCPSKGFLIENDLNADEDYCDHCMGWMGPLLGRVGAEVVVHEHNHCGQCWGEIKMKGKPSQSLDLPTDIRKDPRWQRGYLDRWRNNQKLPLYESASDAVDSCDVLTDWFARAEELTILGRGPSAAEPWAKGLPRQSVLVVDPTYALRDTFDGDPIAVLFGDGATELAKAAQRFHQTPPQRQPLLMHMYLHRHEPAAFAAHNLPRPVPILPLLIRTGLYTHNSHGPYPTSGVFLVLLAAALGKPAHVAGIDLYRHPSGREYVDSPTTGPAQWPAWHSEACDIDHLRKAQEYSRGKIHFSPHLQEILNLAPATQ